MGVRWDRSQDRLIAKSTFHKLSHGHLVMIVGKVRGQVSYLKVPWQGKPIDIFHCLPICGDFVLWTGTCSFKCTSIHLCSDRESNTEQFQEKSKRIHSSTGEARGILDIGEAFPVLQLFPPSPPLPPGPSYLKKNHCTEH